MTPFLHVAAPLLMMLPFSPGGEACRQAAEKAAAAAQSPATLVAHEWGTFTTFAGPDGRSRPFRTTIGEGLPPFVFDERKQAQYVDRGQAVWEGKSNLVMKQRMETPVIYFYTDRERIIDVRVTLRSGRLTEFYPPVRGLFAAGPDMSLDWGKVRLIPETALATLSPSQPGRAKFALPDVPAGNHYAFARQTDAAVVRVCNPDADHYEKFLFYRGAGDFELPLALRALGQRRFEVDYQGPDLIARAFLIETTGGDHIRFQSYRNIGGRQELRVPDEESKPDQLSAEIVEALIAQGLYEKEAVAMVNTWRESWLREDGSRLLYLLPRQITDAVLPLTIDPPPGELVRVMVGRAESLPPETLAALESELAAANAPNLRIPGEARRFVAPANAPVPQTSGESRRPAAADAPHLQSMGEARLLAALGRFAEPALQLVAETSTQKPAAARARELLKAIEERNTAATTTTGWR